MLWEHLKQLPLETEQTCTLVSSSTPLYLLHHTQATFWRFFGRKAETLSESLDLRDRQREIKGRTREKKKWMDLYREKSSVCWDTSCQWLRRNGRMCGLGQGFWTRKTRNKCPLQTVWVVRTWQAMWGGPALMVTGMCQGREVGVCLIKYTLVVGNWWRAEHLGSLLLLSYTDYGSCGTCVFVFTVSFIKSRSKNRVSFSHLMEWSITFLWTDIYHCSAPLWRVK